MDGDLPKLKETVEICEHYHAAIYLDEAHSTFMFGKNGRGIGEHFGVEDRIGIVFGTLSKVLGGVGGFVCSKASTIRYLKCYSSPFQFSCALPPAIVAGVLRPLKSQRGTRPTRQTLENVAYFRKQLLDMDLTLAIRRRRSFRSSSDHRAKNSCPWPWKSRNGGCSSSPSTSRRSRQRAPV